MSCLRITLLLGMLFSATPSFAAPFLYVTNRGDDTVSVIDTASNVVIARVKVSGGPDEIEAHPFGTFVYVSSPEDGTISVIDTSINEVVATVSSLELSVFDMAIHPAGAILYASDTVALLAIDTVTNTVVKTIDVGGEALFVAVHPAGTFLYITNIENAEVLVIDTVTHAVVERVKVDPFPWAMAIHPDGRFVYVGSRANSTISVIDTATNSVVANVFVGPDGNGIAIEDIQVHPEGTFVYVTDITLEGSIHVIDTASNNVVDSIPTQSSHLTPHPEGTFLYASDEREDSIAVIDTATNSVIETIGVSADPEALAIAQPVPRHISGCIDFGGVPLVQRNVTLKQADEEKQKTTTDAKGCYAFEAIAAGKTFKVIIKGPAVP